MKIQYLGESASSSLTNEQVYEAYQLNDFCYAVTDDSETVRFYSIANPVPYGGKRGGTWKVIEA